MPEPQDVNHSGRFEGQRALPPASHQRVLDSLTPSARSLLSTWHEMANQLLAKILNSGKNQR